MQIHDRRGGAAAKLTLASHPGLAVATKYDQPKRAGEWTFVELGIREADKALEVKLDGKFVFSTAGCLHLNCDCCPPALDVSHWRYRPGNTVNLVNGPNDERTRLAGGGRDFVVNDDGTISCPKAPHLVLGVEYATTALTTALAVCAHGDGYAFPGHGRGHALALGPAKRAMLVEFDGDPATEMRVRKVGDRGLSLEVNERHLEPGSKIGVWAVGGHDPEAANLAGGKGNTATVQLDKACTFKLNPDDRTLSPVRLPFKKEKDGRGLPRLVLVERTDAARACVFEHAATLRDGAAAPLTLASHPGFAIKKMYMQPKQHREWFYIELVVGKADTALEAKLDGAFVAAATDCLHINCSCYPPVLDVTGWQYKVENTVNLVNGPNDEKTKAAGGGRDWVLNDDGTLACKKAPQLVLGVQYDPAAEADPRTLR